MFYYSIFKLTYHINNTVQRLLFKTFLNETYNRLLIITFCYYVLRIFTESSIFWSDIWIIWTLLLFRGKINDSTRKNCIPKVFRLRVANTKPRIYDLHLTRVFMVLLFSYMIFISYQYECLANFIYNIDEWFYTNGRIWFFS